MSKTETPPPPAATTDGEEEINWSAVMERLLSRISEQALQLSILETKLAEAQGTK